jgi:nitroreductase
MELLTVIENRASVRQFKNEPVDKDDLREMVRRAGMAPSVNNSQPWKFVAISNKDLLRQMEDAVHRKIKETFPVENDDSSVLNTVDKYSSFFANAPMVIAVLHKPYKAVVDTILDETMLTHDDINRIRNYPNIQSIGAAIEHLQLTAVDLGYGACWLSGLLVARYELERILEVEKPFSLAACVAVGKPSEDVKQRQKKPLSEIFEIKE